MFNNYSYKGGNTTTNTNINAVTGAILKNHPMSWFERFNLKSKRAEALLTEGGHKGFDTKWHRGTGLSEGYYVNEENHDKDIVVLQMVICGDMEVIAEMLDRDIRYVNNILSNAKLGRTRPKRNYKQRKVCGNTQAIITALKSGKRVREICAEFDVSTQYVYQVKDKFVKEQL